MAKHDKVIMLGGGGHAKVVFDALLSMDAEVVAVIDSKYTGDFFGISRVPDYNPDTLDVEAKLVVAVGSNYHRKKEAGRSKHDFANAIHQSVLLSSSAVIGIGNMILHGVIVQSSTVVGNHVILNTGCQIDHDCVINDFVHVGPGSILCGNVEVGEGALIGAGAVVTPGRKIGAWSTIGAGAVVIDDVPENAVVVGVPAKTKS